MENDEMKIVILTSNALRHKFFANTLASHVDDALVISECKPNSLIDSDNTDNIDAHFKLRDQTEKIFFPENDFFVPKTLPIVYKELNQNHVYQTIKNFKPDLIFVFGSYIVKEPLLSLLPAGHIINLHLGLSPYYRGSGTNFWPFVNDELEYLGSTILHLDAGIDTGDIICHVRPTIEIGDNVHTIGCKIIQESVNSLIKIMKLIESGQTLNRTKQWKVNERYYKTKDFNETVLQKYKIALNNGLVKNYLASNKKDIRLINL